MASLEELRIEIDSIDKQIVDLYQRRMTVCEEVGEYKISTGKKVFDKNREREKLSRVTADVSDEFYKKGIRELFEHIMSVSRKLQYQLLTKRGALGRLPFIGVEALDWKNSRIVFQGTEGAYSQAAMEKYFGLPHMRPDLALLLWGFLTRMVIHNYWIFRTHSNLPQ